MKKLLYILSISLIINGCSITGSADVIENGSNNEVIILKVPSEPDTISDDMQYANFEIEVPEITKDIYKNASPAFLAPFAKI